MKSPVWLLLTCLIPCPAGAERAGPAHLEFAVYAAGLHVLQLESEADLAAADHYRIDLHYRTAGLFGAIFESDITSFVQGSWAGNTPVPRRFASWGTLRGGVWRTTIDYVGGQPSLTDLEPPTEEDRDPIPPALERDTVDTLSAMADLIRAVSVTGRCEGTETIYDGRRVLRIVSHTVGEEMLEVTGRSSFSGKALRCDFDGQQLAGFQHDADEEELTRVHKSQAWLARVLPGQQALPVRIVFETRYFGHATAYLTEARPGVAK
jgi:hypothetical protein